MEFFIFWNYFLSTKELLSFFKGIFFFNKEGKLFFMKIIENRNQSNFRDNNTRKIKAFFNKLYIFCLFLKYAKIIFKKF